MFFKWVTSLTVYKIAQNKLHARATQRAYDMSLIFL